MNCQSGSVSIAEWMPRKPPPPRKYVSKASCWASLSTSPAVFRKTTARYLARLLSVNLEASSVTSKVTSFARASERRAATPWLCCPSRSS